MANNPEKEEKEKKRGGLCFVVIFCLLFLVAGFSVVIYLRLSATPIALTDFESGDEGWLVMGDAQGDSNLPTHQASGGNPGAYMEAVDDAVGGVWYWAAPESFRRKVAETWTAKRQRRSVLTFDLRQSDPSNPFDDEDVILSDGETTLFFSHGSPPATDWTSYRVPLSNAGDWTREPTGEPATTDEMNRVMSNLEKLWIRGEFRTGPDTGGIDNIRIR